MDRKFVKAGISISTLGVVVAILAWLFPFSPNQDKQNKIIITPKDQPLNQMLPQPERFEVATKTEQKEQANEKMQRVTFATLHESTKGMMDLYKEEVLIKWIPSIVEGISIKELTELTSGMTDSYKLDVIEVASNYLRGPIDEGGIANLVSRMTDSYKEKAINYVLSGTPKKALPADRKKR